MVAEAFPWALDEAMTDHAKELRRLAPLFPAINPEHAAKVMREAADTLDAQATELREIEALLPGGGTITDRVLRLLSEREALCAERDANTTRLSNVAAVMRHP